MQLSRTRPWIKPMYLRYILMTDFIKKEYMKKAAGGTVQSVPMGRTEENKNPGPIIAGTEPDC